MSFRNLRSAIRQLAQAPVVAAIAVLTLGLGIGANTAIFSVVDAVLLRPLPYPQSDRLIAVRESDRKFPMMSVSYPDYLDWVGGNHSFAALGLYRGTGAVLTHAGPPAIINGQDVAWQYFAAMEIHPELGRTFVAADDHSGAAPVVMLADRFWHERFRGRPDILGQTIELDGKGYTVVGVMPPGFPGLVAAQDAPQYFVPVGLRATKDSGLLNRGSHQGFNGVGRLLPGASFTSARADLERIARNLAQQYPDSNTGESVSVRPFLDFVVRNDGPTALWALLAAVGLVVLIACANVANLLLARAAARHKASAIRAALGASRARLMAEQLWESLVIGIAGSGLGLLLAVGAMRLVPALVPQQMGMTRIALIGLDGRVLAFALVLGVVTSVLAGLAPAWHAGRAQVADVLKQGGRDTSAGASHRVRSALVVAETALAVLLLAGAGLLIRSLVRLRSVDPGFRPQGVLSFEISLPAVRYPKPEQGIEFYRQLRAKLAQLPGVTAVGSVFPLPFSGNDWENSFSLVGRPAPPRGQEPSADYAMVTGDYFHAMGIKLLRGRVFNEGDTATSPPVTVIDEHFAKQYWPGRNSLDAALGQQIKMGNKSYAVVGVAGRVLGWGLDASSEMDALPEMWVPMSQGGDTTDTEMTLRTQLADPITLRSAVTSTVASLDPDQPLDQVMTMDQCIQDSLGPRQLALDLMAGFAGLALLLGAIGIYGVLSYTVLQRRHEIGLRMALGASRGTVLARTLAQGLRWAAVGAGLGVLAALALGRYAASLLWGVSATDPVTLLTVPVVLLAVAALACLMPAWRATRVDPMIALRGE